jgi:hypothetical protein
VVAARSKTVENDRSKTTVTYRKEQMSDGTVNRSTTEKSTP